MKLKSFAIGVCLVLATWSVGFAAEAPDRPVSPSWQSLQSFATELWSSVIEQRSLIWSCFQIVFLILVLFSYTAHHALRRRREREESALYGESVTGCGCGLPQAQCDWCKEERTCSR